jgi:hypothetical protein
MRNYVYNVRITDELKERLWKMTKETGVQHTGLVEDFIKNLCNFYEKNGEIRPPFVILPKKDYEQMNTQLERADSKPAPDSGVAPTGAGKPVGRTRIKSR